MFRCRVCKLVAPARTPAHTYVTTTRVKVYEVPTFDEEGEPTGVKEVKGSEIVREIQVCPTCWKDLEVDQPF